MSARATQASARASRRDAAASLLVALPLGALAAALAVIPALWSPLLPLLIVAVLGYFALAVMRPVEGLAVCLLLIPAETLTLPFQGGAFGLTPSEGALIISAAAWLVRRAARREPVDTMSSLLPPMLLLLLATGVGLIVALEPFFVVKELVMTAVFLVILQLVTTEADMKGVRRLISALALSGGIVGLIAIGQGGGEAATALTAANRAVGSFTQPNVLGLFLALSIPCQVALALKGPGILRPLAALCFGLAVAGLALSLSRGAFLGVVGALTLMAAWKPFRRALLVAAVAFLTLAMVGLNPLAPVLKGGGELVNRITSTRYDDNTQPRVVLYRRTPRLIADNPVFGVGANNFGQYASEYGFVDIAAGVPANHAHNLPLTIAAERGLLGLGAVIWFAVALVRNLRRGARARSTLTRAMVVAVAGALMVLLLEGLVDYGLGTNAIFATVIVLAACTNVFARQAEQETSASPGREIEPPVRAPARGGRRDELQAV